MSKSNNVIKLELTEEELEKGCKKKIFVDDEFVEVEIPKNSNPNERIAVEVEDKDGNKKKITLLLLLLLVPLKTKGEDIPNKESGMKPRRKGMKYSSPKKGIGKGIIAIGGGGVAIAIIALVLLLPKNNTTTSTPKENNKLDSNMRHQVTCEFYFNENRDNEWVPIQEFHYDFLFNNKEDKIESIHLSEQAKYNTGSAEERKKWINNNTYSILPGGSDEEIKKTYYSGCETCNVSGGVMTTDYDLTLEEFMNNSNLRNDEDKTLMKNLMETFNNQKSCEEGFYPFVPYSDTQSEYCPTENFRSNCTVKDVK